ncbi:hypothetical protein ACOME3_000377 [Neoechinorhynchus agilis]
MPSSTDEYSDGEGVTISLDELVAADTKDKPDEPNDVQQSPPVDESKGLTDDEVRDLETAIFEFERRDMFDVWETNEQMDECERYINSENSGHPRRSYFSLWVPGYGHVTEAKYEEIYGRKPEPISNYRIRPRFTRRASNVTTTEESHKLRKRHNSY